MIIVISGQPGAGKSSTAKSVASTLDYDRKSSGDFQRQLAKERGITIHELGELEAKDPSLDLLVDNRQKEYGLCHDNFVIDSWLGALFIPHATKFFLYADEETRAKRIFYDTSNKTRMDVEKNQSLDHTKLKMIERDRVNIERWKRYYNGFDYRDPQHYDLVINTSRIETPQVAGIILHYLKETKV